MSKRGPVGVTTVPVPSGAGTIGSALITEGNRKTEKGNRNINLFLTFLFHCFFPAALGQELPSATNIFLVEGFPTSK
jgi:hypothetical protein